MIYPEGIIFDLGNTLIERISFTPIEGIKRILKFSKISKEIDPEKIQELTLEIKDEIKNLKKNLNIEFNIQQLHKIIFDRLDLAFTIDENQLEKEYHNNSMEYRPLPGAYETLEFLKNKNIKLGILSNSIFSGSIINDVLKTLQMDHYFSFVISSADYGIKKPEQLIFNNAIYKMKLPTNKIWYIGDNIETDLIGAKLVNLYTIWLNQFETSSNIEVDIIINQLTDLKFILSDKIS